MHGLQEIDAITIVEFLFRIQLDNIDTEPMKDIINIKSTQYI